MRTWIFILKVPKSKSNYRKKMLQVMAGNTNLIIYIEFPLLAGGWLWDYLVLIIITHPDDIHEVHATSEHNSD